MQKYIDEGFSLEKAAELAADYCLKHDILKEFLDKHLEEVKNMLTKEWSLEEAQEVWFEEGMEKGIEKGMEKGIEQTARNMLNKGFELEVIAAITGLNLEVIKKL
ncbi:MAG: hypothetical protein FWE37_03080 [Spirochaetaceae bacterium]|nr:hypothetical protein [Spirochaetaceae bacterium]